MRKHLIPLVAASMLAPATAHAEENGLLRGLRTQAERSSQGDDNSDNRASRSEKSERSTSERQPRAERAPREDRTSRVERVQRVDRNESGERAVQDADRVRRADRDGQRMERVRRADRGGQQVEQVQVTDPAPRAQETERRRSGGLADAFARTGQDMADGRSNHRDDDRDWRGDRDRHRDRDGDRDWRGDRDGRHRWNRDWRRDGRYDWHGHRDRYRSVFRLGRYYDPYGWDYRRFTVGLNLWPSYYGSSFWLDDPWQYRLPPVYGPYRWVRYYDDAVLVNIYTGQVVDVIYNVFW